MQRRHALLSLAVFAALTAGGPTLAASTEGPLAATPANAEAAPAVESSALSGVIYQPSRLGAKAAPAPAAPGEADLRALAASNTAFGAEVSELLAKANGADMTRGSQVNVSDQPPMVIGEMAGLARKSCERAGGAFEAGGTGVFLCR